MTISEYCFYFDESFHDRKITNKLGNGLNINKSNSSDIFIGAFTGFKTTSIKAFEEDYKKFEEKYKIKFTIDINKELKAVNIIKRKNFEAGFSKFNKNTIEFYNDYFGILINNRCVFQVNFMSKIEFLVFEVMKDIDFCKFSPYVNKKAFMYSLIKVIHNYESLGIAKKLVNNKHITNEKIIKLLIISLTKIENKIVTIKRKESELQAIRQMKIFLNEMKFYLVTNEEVIWDYGRIFYGLQLLLDELKIQPSEVEILLDKEASVLEAGKKNNCYHKIDSYNSDEVLGIRAADILSNFFGRMIHSLQKELQEVDLDIKTERNLLSASWFKLNNAQFNLVKKMASLFKFQKYYSTYTSLYCDYTVVIFSYIHYINSFKSYEEYELEKRHWENGNNYILSCMEVYIDKLNNYN